MQTKTNIYRQANSKVGRPALKAGALYSALVFGTGFVLGTVRILWILARVGTRWAELLEMPILFVVIVFAARWIDRHFRATTNRFPIGLLALCFLLVAEFAVAVWLRHLTVPDYLASRDPVAGTAYLILLGVFAKMPALMARRRAR